jgi:hypothetical protein
MIWKNIMEVFHSAGVPPEMGQEQLGDHGLDEEQQVGAGKDGQGVDFGHWLSLTGDNQSSVKDLRICK